MGKEEKMLTELLEKISTLEDKITNMEFLLVQGMGTGGGSLPTPSPSVNTGQIPAGAVKVDLAPIENRITLIEENVKVITNQLTSLTEVTKGMQTEKTQKADELITQATTLLERGLQLTELETTMLEVKDRLEEIIVQLEVANVGVVSEEKSS
ncbi:MAG: hypothetical protein EAX86_00050 [Candidatus Heimdallarchaeota archaeon]|nr:hypothetical protein [Candidatus Heimdallarchaeota archaeon]